MLHRLLNNNASVFMSGDEMALSYFIVLMTCVWLSSATYNRLEWSDCGSDPSLSIQMIEVTPMPIVLPGPLQLSVRARMNRSMSDAEVQLSIKRSTFLFDLPVPCIFHVGSCTYDVSCSGKSILDTMISENWAGVMTDMGHQIKGLLTAMPGLNTTACPVPPASVDVQHYTLNLPAVPGALAVFASGDYSAKVTLREKSSGKTLLCLNTHVTLHKKEEPCTGFFCG